MVNNTAAVDTANNAIVISGIDPADEIVRGEQLDYESGGVGAKPIGGLTSGSTYYVTDVISTQTQSDGTLTQEVRLASAQPIALGISQINKNSVQSLSQLQLSTFDSSAVSNGSAGNLTINNSLLSMPLVNGDVVTYVGTSTPVALNNLGATFARSAGGDTITRTDGGPTWDAEGLIAGEQIVISNAASAANDATYTIKSISSDGSTLTLTAANQVTAGADPAFSLATTPTAPALIGGLTNAQQYTVSIVNGQVLLQDLANSSAYIKFSAQGAGLQGFTLLRNTFSFSPATAVDPSADTITLANNTLQTGDVVIYNTDTEHLRVDAESVRLSPTDPPRRPQVGIGQHRPTPRSTD